MQLLILAALLMAPPAEAETASAVSPETNAPAQEPEEEPLHEWHGSLSVGAGFTSGNTDTDSFGVNAEAKYRREHDRTTLKLFYDRKFADDVRQVDRSFGEAKYDYFFSEKTYLYGQARAEKDRVADLDLRYMLGSGVGHQFAESAVWKLSGEVGLSYVNEDYSNNSADDDYVAARLAYDVEYTPSERWGLGQSTDFFPSLEDSEDWYLVVDTYAKANLTDTMFGKLTYLYTNDNTPSPGNEEEDHVVQLTIGWNF